MKLIEELPASKLKHEQLLIAYLAQHQGADVGAENYGYANNATTYRVPFCEAGAALIRLYETVGLHDPIGRMSQKFIEANIRTCRGNTMTRTKAEYLYAKHLRPRLVRGEYLQPKELENFKPSTA